MPQSKSWLYGLANVMKNCIVFIGIIYSIASISFTLNFAGTDLHIYFPSPNAGYLDAKLKSRNILDYVVKLRNYGITAVDEMSSLKVQIKSCKDGVVFLSSSELMDSAEPFYEIVFGAYTNTRTYLLKRNNDSLLQSSMTEVFQGGLPTEEINTLNCLEFRPFWINWSGGHIKIGRGSTLGVNMFVEWEDPSPSEVRSIGICTWWGNTGEWKIYIEDLYSGYYSGCGENNLRADLNILQSLNSSRSVCGIICNLQIKQQCQITDKINTELDGYGADDEVGRPYTDDSANFNIHIHSPNAGGLDAKLKTPNILDYVVHLLNYGITAVDEITSLKLQIKSCKYGVVFLSSSELMDSAEPFYEIVFGTYSNTQTYILKRNNDSLLPSSMIEVGLPTEEINTLNCSEFRPFWISWSGGHIRIGRGSTECVNMFVEWEDPSPLKTRSIGICTFCGNTGEWRISIEANEDTVSQLVKAWNTGSVCDRSMPSALERSWIDIYLKLFPLPNASHNSSAPTSRKSETAMTATSVSTVRIMTRLSPCFTASDTCTLILVSASSCEHGAKLENHHVVDNIEHPEHLLLQLPFPQNFVEQAAVKEN
ncbi:unnamed protein product [Mytilus coruscus]|uniref:Farnesoic acid O-methyl transferase domain-containing protein n=1 Tax=Mytilus coruscus TaxID=42192 RepID=A0A6J8DK61_MYTCO|nr:unnamed protein product [Mytilus coruscus]